MDRPPRIGVRQDAAHRVVKINIGAEFAVMSLGQVAFDRGREPMPSARGVRQGQANPTTNDRAHHDEARCCTAEGEAKGEVQGEGQEQCEGQCEGEGRDFGPLEVVLFSGLTRPGDRNQFYAVLTQLKKYDVSQQKELMSVDLDHSYYCLNFSTDGSKVYLAGTFNDIAIHDADTLQKLGNIELPGGDMSLSTAQVFARLP